MKLSVAVSGVIDQVLLDVQVCCVKVVLRLYETRMEDDRRWWWMCFAQHFN